MILILEDDIDREIYRRGRFPLTPDYTDAERTAARAGTVWISPEAYEEKVRADERERLGLAFMHSDEIRRDANRATLADLRAKAAALQVFNVDSGVDPYRYVIEPLVRRADVLALFDGSSDD